MLKYNCNNCDSTFPAQRKRKKCPICKSSDLVEGEVSVSAAVSQTRIRGEVRATGINNFVDDLSEFKDEIKIGKKIYKAPKPTTRESNVVNVRCTKCGKDLKMNASIIGNRASFRCNGCIVGE
jgi:DNA-directed RNA polymerase subunit RPC12/RpoP